MPGVMTSTRIRSETPCCGREVRLYAIDGIPRQRFDRTCAGCGTEWAITRTTRLEQAGTIRIDQLDWQIPRPDGSLPPEP